MELLEGLRRNSKVFVDENNFIYTTSKINGAKRYLRCRDRACGGRGILTGEDFQIREVHNHAPDAPHVSRDRFLTNIRERARKTTTPLFSVFVNAEIENEAGALEYGPYKNAKRIMHRSRCETLPRIPHSVEEYARIIGDNMWMERFGYCLGDNPRPFFSRLAVGEDNSTSALFLSPTIKTYVQNINNPQIHVDGTFKVVPQYMGAVQLFTVHVVYEGIIYPLAYVLMSNKTQSAYEAVFTQIIEQVPTLQNAHSLMGDFETATRNAARVVFGNNITILGCWFHFCRALDRKAKRLNIYRIEVNGAGQQDIKTIVHMAMALPLLPDNLLNVGFDIIAEEIAMFQGAEVEQLRTFLMYLRRTWQNKNISVFGQSHRTNNAIESFHRNVMRLVGKPHPNVWEFHKHLQSVELHYSLNFFRHFRQGQAQEKLLKYKARDALIRRQEAILIDEGNIRVFLRRMAHETRNIPRVFINNEEEAEANEADDELLQQEGQAALRDHQY